MKKIILTLTSLLSFGVISSISFTELPIEILDRIAQYAGYKGSSELARTDKKMRAVVENLRTLGKLPYPIYVFSSHNLQNIPVDYTHLPHTLLNERLNNYDNNHLRSIALVNGGATRLPIALAKYPAIKHLIIDFPQLGSPHYLLDLLHNNLYTRLANHLLENYGQNSFIKAVQEANNVMMQHPHLTVIGVRIVAAINQLAHHDAPSAEEAKDTLFKLIREENECFSISELSQRLPNLQKLVIATYHGNIQRHWLLGTKGEIETFEALFKTLTA